MERKIINNDEPIDSCFISNFLDGLPPNDKQREKEVPKGNVILIFPFVRYNRYIKKIDIVTDIADYFILDFILSRESFCDLYFRRKKANNL